MAEPMGLNESIRSRAHRTLKALAGFRGVDQADIPDVVRVQFQPDEELLGIYANSDVDVTANLVFTTRGIYHFAGDWRCLAYADIASVDIVRGDNFRKLLADTLVFRVKDGTSPHLTISGWKPQQVADGGDLRFADIYEMLRFLMRVLKRVQYGT
jgi:hypothetical protein